MENDKAALKNSLTVPLNVKHRVSMRSSNFIPRYVSQINENTVHACLLRLMSIESVMPFNLPILCRPLLLPSIFSSIRVFSNESILCIRWPKYWTFSFSISTVNEYSEPISFRVDCLDLLAG